MGILDLELEQAATFTTFVAIEDGAVKSGYEDLVETSCSGGKCLARIVLINAFFASGVSHPIDVSGTVLLAFNNRRRRLDLSDIVNAGLEEQERRLQGNSADFDVVIDLDIEERENCDNGGGLFAPITSILNIL